MLKKIITEVIDSVVSLKTVRLKKNNLPWVDSEMKNNFIARDKLHSLIASYDKTHSIWNTYRELRNACKSLLRKKMNAYYSEKTASYFKSSKKF